MIFNGKASCKVIKQQKGIVVDPILVGDLFIYVTNSKVASIEYDVRQVHGKDTQA